jgi:uncharacterized protein YjcR
MATTNNLIDLEYTNNPFDLYDKTIWDIKNNEKKQLIEYIDNIISTKFEKKITEQNNIIKELIEENKKMNETLNNISTKFEKKITEQNKIIKQFTEENKIIKQNKKMNEKCKVCNKSIYAMDPQINLDGAKFHKSCALIVQRS